MAESAQQAVFRLRGRRTQQHWEGIAQKHLEDGQIALAYDIARLGLQYYPQSQTLKHVCARALTRTGALEEAREMLEGMCGAPRPDDETLRRLASSVREAVTQILNDSGSEPSGAMTEAVSELFRVVSTAARATGSTIPPDAESLSLLARVYKDLWRETGDRSFAEKSFETYHQAFRETPASYYSGVNAATVAWLLGRQRQAHELAGQALTAAAVAEHQESSTPSYWSLVTQGEAHLLLGRSDEAIRSYRNAVLLDGVPHLHHVSSLQQLLLLRDTDKDRTLPGLDRILHLFKPPAVIVFVGHRLDEPGRIPPRFPAGKEKLVRRLIDERLEKLEAKIGYCSAANGSDILFIDAMRDRDAEVNVVLPFDQVDFIKTSVSHPRYPKWRSRFNQALRSASSVKYATSELYDDMTDLFGFGSEVARGLAELHAASLETEPCLLAVYDGRESGLAGGTSDVIRRWGKAGRVEIIDLPTAAQGRARRQAPPRLGAPAHMSYLTRRELKTMLFADVAGYSSLSDKDTPLFIDRFLRIVARKLNSAIGRRTKRFVNTWGDAVFAVMDDPLAMMDYACALQSAVKSTDWKDAGFPEQLRVRIALHVGPVYSGQDPLTRRANYYGAHVNRAARLEPVTLPNRIYATEQFVALLVSRLLSEGRVQRREGRATPLPYQCEYVGNLELAKGFGEQRTYHLRLRPVAAVRAKRQPRRGLTASRPR